MTSDRASSTALAQLAVARHLVGRGELLAAEVAVRAATRGAAAALDATPFPARLARRLAPVRASLSEVEPQGMTPDALGQAIDVLERAIDLASASPRRRRLRAVAVAIWVALTCAYFAYAIGVRPFGNVVASGVFFDDPNFRGSRAYDGQLDTEWLPPDGPHASIDIYPFPARTVHTVVVHNGHNRQYLDRGVATGEVSVYARGVLVERLPVRFDAVSANGESRALHLRSEVRGVDHVRFAIHAVHGLGGAVAEIELR